MNIFILVVGLLCIAIAIALFIKNNSLQKEIFAIKATETSTVADLKAIRDNIADELGNMGAWRQQVEVKGHVVCSNPLTAQLSQRPCVYSHTVILEQYEEEEDTTDEEGEVTTTTHSGSKTISNNQTQINFWLEDATGKIEIDPLNAKIDGLTVVKEFEPKNQIVNSRYRIIGYQKTEKIIAVESFIYVLGGISDADGKLKICAPSDRQEPFFISYKSEEELIKAKASSSKSSFFWGIGLSIAGLSMALLSLISILS